MKELALPKARGNVNQATLRRWLRSVGQQVNPGDLIAEFETENALIHIEATEAGVIMEQLIEHGTTLNVGEVFAHFDPNATGSEPDSIFGTTAPPVAEKSVETSSATASEPTAQSENPKTTEAPDLSEFTPILMPQAGNSMEEGTILQWNVAVGDTIELGQIICEIETDKATMEFESPEAGRLAAIVANVDDIVEVKKPIAYIGEDELNLGAINETASEPSATEKTANSASISDEDIAELEKRVTPILMPQAGNSMEEGTILQWMVQAGDTVREGDILCEIETDKATMEYESPAAGRVAKLVAAQDQTIEIKKPIAVLADNDADAEQWLAAQSDSPLTQAMPPTETKPSAAAAPTAPPVQPTAVTTPTQTPSSSNGRADTPRTDTGRVMASPAARKLANERNIDLEQLGPGSGPRGRIVYQDVQNAKPGSVSSSKPAPPTKPDIEPLKLGIGEAATTGQVITKPMTKMRRAIATNLQQSKQTVPHFYITISIDAGPLFTFYKTNKPATGCTVNDVVLLGVGKVMAEFPAVRSQIHDRDVVEFPTANVGIAVGVPDGLVVPVVMHVDRLTLADLATETKRINTRAREGQIENMGKGNFTISNLGMFGVQNFSAIINPPESGILAISAIREEVIVENGAMRPGKVMTLTLSADHRILDGLVAAQFVKRLKEVLEHPALLEG